MSIVENACRLRILPEQFCADHYQEDPDVPRLVEMITHKIPVLKEVENHSVRLSRPVAMALSFARQLTEKLGHPRRLDRNLWTKDPFIPILFDSPEDGAKVLRRSKVLRHVFETQTTEDCFFLMTMRRHEFEIMGSELDGEIIKRDVLQTVISFEDHAIPIAAFSEQKAHAMISDEIVLYLAQLIPERLRQAVLLRGELEHSEMLLKAQIRTLEQASRQHKSYDVPSEIRTKLKDGLQEADLFADKLKALPKNPTPPEYLGLVRNVLLHPDKHLFVDDVRVHVQEFGIKVPKEKGREIRFLEFRAWGVQSMAVLFAAMGRESAVQLWPELGEEN